MMKTLDLTPNMPRMFAQFLEFGRNSAFRLPDNVQRYTAHASYTPELLRVIQGPLAELNVALYSMTTTEELEQFRVVFAEVVKYLDATAAKLEGEL